MHVQVKPLNQYPWYIRPFFWNQKRKYGAVLDPGSPLGAFAKAVCQCGAYVWGAGSQTLAPQPGAALAW